MNKPLVIGIGILVLVLLTLFSTTYHVSFHEVAIRQTFGQATEESVVVDPGLHFKLPIFADQITKIDTRMQLEETALETVATTDGQQVMVRAFLLWQIERDRDAVLRFQRAYGSIDHAAQQLTDRMKTAVAAGVGRYRFIDLVGPESRLADAEAAIMSELEGLRQEGIAPVSVGISQVLLPPRTTSSVLDRMRATRETIQQAERFKGDAEAERIESEARTMVDRIMAFASARAEEIRAAGNEEAARYIRMMAEDENFAIFLNHLDTLEATLTQHTTVILPTDLAPYHLMRLSATTDSRGIPMPDALLEERLVGAASPISAADNPATDNPADKDEPSNGSAPDDEDDADENAEEDDDAVANEASDVLNGDENENKGGDR